MKEDSMCLDEYGAKTGHIIHVVDTNPSELLTNLDDLSQVPKYELSEDEYNQRENTFRKFKKEMMQKNPEFMNAHSTQIVPDY